MTEGAEGPEGLDAGRAEAGSLRQAMAVLALIPTPFLDDHRRLFEQAATYLWHLERLDRRQQRERRRQDHKYLHWRVALGDRYFPDAHAHAALHERSQSNRANPAR
jgi:hypothetical protein